MRSLHVYTVQALESVTRANGFAEARALMTADGDQVRKVVRASLTIDDYTKTTCGFSIHNEGPPGS